MTLSCFIYRTFYTITGTVVGLLIAIVVIAAVCFGICAMLKTRQCHGMPLYILDYGDGSLGTINRAG
jgi:hypothetical protein